MGNFLNVNDIGNLKSQVTPAVILDASGNIVDFGSIIASSGNVIGPGSSTDNAVVRWDGSGGTNIQNSTLIVSDTGTMTNTVSGNGFLGTIALPFSGVVAKIVSTNVIQGPGGGAQNVILYENGQIDAASVGGFNIYAGGGDFNVISYAGQCVIAATSNAILVGGDAFVIGSSAVHITGNTSVAGDITPEASGTRNIGSRNFIFSNVVAQTGNFGTITGLSAITIASDLVPTSSGSSSLGSQANPYAAVYTKLLVQTTGSSGGSAAASGIGAWASWNYVGGTPTASGVYNVASFTDGGVGITTVNYTTNMANTKYAANYTIADSAGVFASLGFLGTTGVQCISRFTATYVDAEINSVSITN